nr:hypothetical protein [uncultured Carboxylicivirga sp.]
MTFKIADERRKGTNNTYVTFGTNATDRSIGTNATDGTNGTERNKLSFLF